MKTASDWNKMVKLGKKKKSGEHFLILDISNASMAGSRLVWENLRCLVGIAQKLQKFSKTFAFVFFLRELPNAP